MVRMQKSKRTTLAAVLTLVAALVAAPAASARPGASYRAGGIPVPAGCDAAPIDKALNELRTVGATGISVTVESPRCGVITTGVGVADRTTGRPVVGDEHGRIASDTKTWVATVAMQLVAEGRLCLDDTVDQHLPGLIRNQYYDGRTITVRQLMQHTSGLPEYLDTFANEDDARWLHLEPVDTVDLALKLKPPKRSASGFFYSNTNYNVLGMIIKQITGNDVATEVENRIITPLGLTGTSWPPGDETTLPAPELRGYAERGDHLEDRTEWNVSGVGASGALVSTSADVTAFWSALFSGELLPPGLLADMEQTIDDGENGRYGLALERYERVPGFVTWGHSGSMESGHHLENAVTADGLRAVTLLIGSDDFDLDKVNATIGDLIYNLR